MNLILNLLHNCRMDGMGAPVLYEYPFYLFVYLRRATSMLNAYILIFSYFSSCYPDVGFCLLCVERCSIEMGILKYAIQV